MACKKEQVDGLVANYNREMKELWINYISFRNDIKATAKFVKGIEEVARAKGCHKEYISRIKKGTYHKKLLPVIKVAYYTK